jgi:flagellar basal body P-ring formation protein FlgA
MMRVFLFAWALLLCWPAYGGVRVVVPAHDIARGTTLSDSDLTFATVNGSVMNGTVMDKSDLVGLQARRFLRMGENVRLEDVRHPVLVSKGTTVTMSFEAPGIVLTATGKAMSEGGMGDTVTVQNPASYRQISAVVIGPGQVRAQMGSARLASLQP